eukprot:scaffold20842_cov33-Tisochrysis_lutea.AAC.7
MTPVPPYPYPPQAHAYRHFQQSSSFQSLLDLKAKESYVPNISDFKLLQILGEGYEGKVLQARKKDCGVMYALKVLDKQVHDAATACLLRRMVALSSIGK